MANRGYSCIALDSPKDHANVGGVLRAAWIYESQLVVIGRARFRRSPTDTMNAHLHMPVIRAADVFDALPFDCIPVAVDLIDGAIPLPEFQHPPRAFYIFGGEDATLGQRVTSRCKHVVYVPMRGCMNLAASVNVVLYDRLAKQMAGTKTGIKP